MASTGKYVMPWQESKMQPYQWVDSYLQALPATQKEFQPAWQAYKYMLHKKMYAYIGFHDKTGRPIITLKLEPTFSEMLRREYEDITQGYYMNKLYWSTVYLDGAVPKEVLTDIASASYNMVFSSLSKKAQQEIAEHNLK